jgi:hypothetical protein
MFINRNFSQRSKFFTLVESGDDNIAEESTLSHVVEENISNFHALVADLRIQEHVVSALAQKYGELGVNDPKKDTAMLEWESASLILRDLQRSVINSPNIPN